MLNSNGRQDIKQQQYETLLCQTSLNSKYRNDNDKLRQRPVEI